jgi:hypothetical protein
MGVPVVTGAIYFDNKEANNTKPTLAAAKSRADELGIKDIIVATTSGTTGIQAVEIFKDDFKLIIITHSTGFKEPNQQSLSTQNRRILEDSGAKVFTGTHAFGGVGRAVRFKFNTYEVDEIIANTLRIFSQGVKVAIEITLMAADAGLISTEREVVAVGGSGKGADTALVIKPANVQRFFDLQVMETICKPREP